jgi:hypothetical protein
MGQDKIRYFRFHKGRWLWRPEAYMRAYGFQRVNMGHGGPGLDLNGHPEASLQDKQRAMQLNAEWDLARKTGQAPSAPSKYPPGSVGDGYLRAMKARQALRAKNGEKWDADQDSRDDWPRAWRFLDPMFGMCDPKTIEAEDFLCLDEETGEPIGLIPHIETKVSPRERHRTIRVWRALWSRMKSYGYTGDKTDPSLAIPNEAVSGRKEVWKHREVVRLVKRAWKLNYKGLAALIAVAWDTQFSPVDCRTLTPAKLGADAKGELFKTTRKKTGEAAIGTLSQASVKILGWYLRSLEAELLDNSPIFRTPSTSYGPKGGRQLAPVPYTKGVLSRHFKVVREAEFGPHETRQFQDLRRSGTVEAFAGGAQAMAVSRKMANTLDHATQLQETYNPSVSSVVRTVDDARLIGRTVLREQNAKKTVPSSEGKLSLAISAKRKSLETLAGVEGLEPPTPGFGDRCSRHLRYTPSAAAL